MMAYYEKLNALMLASVPFISVTLVDARGSAPQDAGTKMLVTHEGLHYGTVGGGKLEMRALAEAKRLLENPEHAESTFFVDWNLNTDIGMTCGGSVKLYFESFNLNPWKIVVFGAGHVANSLINLLVNLDCQITCIDPREEWLEKLPDSPKLKRIHTQNMPGEVPHLDEHAFVLLMTMGHTTDKPILLEILEHRHFPYLGVIGSRAKAARLKQDIAGAGLPSTCQDAFFCPIGLDIGSNHPQEIAISVIAQLLQERDRSRNSKRIEEPV